MLKHLALTALAVTTLAACNPQNTTATPAASTTSATVHEVDIQTARGVVKLAQNPSKIAVFDLASLDTLEALGVPVAGSPKKVYVPYLMPMAETANNIGTLFEPNLEALNALKPQLIIISTRTAPKYDELAAIAPTIDMSDSGQDLIGDGMKLLDNFGVLFNKEAEARRLHTEVQNLLAETQAAAKGKGNGLILMVNAGKLSAFGPQSRFGWIHKDVGIAAADTAIQIAPHGQPVSFEYIRKINPDWLFVLDRSAAIGEEGKAAKSVLDNELVRQTKAWQAGHVVYLSAASYVAAGGVQQMKTDLSNIKAALTSTIR